MPDPARSDGARDLPDFVILGAMKAGSTTTFRRILAHPGVSEGCPNEPNFFSRDELWSQGLGWYRARFNLLSEGLRGEASVEYADPHNIATVMARLVETAPDVRLLFIARHPVERLRSHYRHQVQRSRERRPLADALADDTFGYVRRSQYSRTISVVLDTVPRDQLLVLDTDRLDDAASWDTIWAHLGLPPAALDSTSYNVAATKEGFSPAMLALWERGWLDRVKVAPKPLRKLGRKLLMRRGGDFTADMAASNAPLPPAVTAVLEQDAAQFLALVGWEPDRWSFA